MKASIAVLAAISEVGGAEISILELASRLRDHYQFHFIVPGEGPLKAKAEQAGAITWVLNWPRALEELGETRKQLGWLPLLSGASRLPRLARQLSALLEQIRPSILVTNAIKCHVLGGLAKRAKTTPLVWYLRDGMEQRGLSRRILRLLSPRCRAAVCISRYIADEARSQISFSLPISVIYNIVDLTKFRPALPAPQDLPKRPGEVWFGNVGALTPLKGQDLFLQAAEIVAEQLPHARFLIVGGQPYKTRLSSDFPELLRRQAAMPLLKNKVAFLGFRGDLPEIVSNLDVFVQSNRGPEGLGRSVIEAMASAVPPLVVDRWGPAELVATGSTGLRFPPGDIKAMAEHMVSLGKDALLRRHLGDNARVWVEQNLAPDCLTEQARQFFDHLLRGTDFALPN